MNAERLKVDKKAARRLALRAEAVEIAANELRKKSGHARNARVRRLVENGEPNFHAEEIGRLELGLSAPSQKSVVRVSRGDLGQSMVDSGQS